ncbi:hypothetical protein HYY69_06715 [Candidatus Woesearchaeota archaeon]|nr:hypothetical protein [Candidatus Woesearchaeota archaeon]
MPEEKSKLETIVFPLLIVILFIPLALFAANTIFPQYKDYYQYQDCYAPYMAKPMPADYTQMNETQRSEWQKCQKEQEEKQKEYEAMKEKYDMYRFFIVLGLSIVALLVTLFLTLRKEIHNGLFIGSVLATVVGLVMYFKSTSWIALGLLVILFISVLWFMNRRTQ